MHCLTKEITILHALWYTNPFNSFMNYDKSRLVYLEVKYAYMRAHELLMSIWCTKVLYLYDSPGEIHSLFARVVLCRSVEQLILSQNNSRCADPSQFRNTGAGHESLFNMNTLALVVVVHNSLDRVGKVFPAPITYKVTVSQRGLQIVTVFV